MIVESRLGNILLKSLVDNVVEIKNNNDHNIEKKKNKI